MDIKNLFKKAFYYSHGLKLQKKYGKTNVSIISQNCVGGVLYSLFGSLFASPTINLVIYDEDFVKICENPKHYFGIDAVPLLEANSKEGKGHPLIIIDDIVVHAVHYKNCAHACEAWNRRRKRFNFDKYVIIAMAWDLHYRNDLIERLQSLGDKCLIVSNLPKHEGLPNVCFINPNVYSNDENGFPRHALTERIPKSSLRYFERDTNIIDWLFSHQ